MNRNRYIIYSPTLSYGSEPLFIPQDGQIPSEGFVSLYSVSANDAEDITAAGTTAKFMGCVWSERLWLDADSDEAASKVKEKLDELGYNYVAFVTGNRGGHFGILRSGRPSHLLPQQDRSWATTHFEGLVDLSIYTHLHLFRLPGTRHHKTGLRKELVLSVEGNTLTLPKVERTSGRLNVTITPDSSNDSSVFDCRRVMGNSVPMKNGERHATLVRLAYALRDAAGLTQEVALWWMLEVNKMFEERKDEKEVENINRKVYGEP